MRRKKQKGTKTAIVSVAIAGALVIVLLLAGALLRMNSRGMGFAEALVSFLRDTFNPGAFKPGT